MDKRKVNGSEKEYLGYICIADNSVKLNHGTLLD